MLGLIITPLISFLLLSVAGGYLAQRWQRAAWAKQQTFLGREKEYEALKSLTEEIALISAKRLYSSRHVLAALRFESTERFEQAVDEYAEIVRDWNIKLQSFYVRLTFYASYVPYVSQLENSIHRNFYNTGNRIEVLIRRRRATDLNIRGDKALDLDLNAIEGRLFKYNRDLVKMMEHRRREIYYGVKIRYECYNLQKLTNLELIKLLFKPRIESHSVFRASFDFPAPGDSGHLGTGVNE